MNTALTLGKPKGTTRKYILWVLAYLAATAAISYLGYLLGKSSLMISSPTTLIIFVPYIYFLWRNESKNSFIEINEETIAIRNGFGVDRFSLSDIDELIVKSGSLFKTLSFSALGTKRWYFINGLTVEEINQLTEYAQRVKRF